MCGWCKQGLGEKYIDVLPRRAHPLTDLITPVGHEILGMSNNSKNTPPPRILIVEDDINIRMMLTAILKAEGYLVDAIRKGAEPLLAIPEKYYSAAILNPGLPEVNSTSVLKAWMILHPNLPVIVLTAEVSQNFKQECLDAGAFAFLLKPCNVDELKRVVREAVG